MKKIVFLCVLAFTFFSCDDGDLTIEEIDLTTTATIQTCTSPTPEGVTLLFKINSAETLILEVPNTLLINEATLDDNEARTSELNVEAFCYYRSFDTSITSSYFCDQLPSDIPVALEYVAVSGTVQVITTETIDDVTMLPTEYVHNIKFLDVVFTGTNGQDVRYSEFEYGDITTAVAQ